MPARVVFLNGSPSAGKSTLARALWQALDEPFFYVDLDDFLQGYGPRWASRRASVIPAWLPILRTLALGGHDLIAPAVVVDSNRSQYVSLFGTGEFTVYFIGVLCPLEEAQRRESVRTGRRLGPIDLAVPEWDQIHRHSYDLEIDTSVTTPLDGARAIRRLLRSTPSPRAFAALEP